MFSGLTNLLFGNKTTENQSENHNINTNKYCNISFKTKEDDGWVVVSGKKKRRKGQNDLDEFTEVDIEDVPPSLSLDISNDFEMDCEFGASPTPSQTAALSTPSTPSSLTHLEPDGSWYLTPPPCFTAGSNTSATPVLSPMENLLIEHPSMSVYQRSSVSQVEASSLKETQSTATIKKTENPEAGLPNKPPVKITRDPAASVTSCRSSGSVFAQVFNKDLIPEALKLKNEKRKTKNLCRNQLDRSNKTREFSSAGRHNRRKDRLRSPSGMNNNRKC